MAAVSATTFALLVWGSVALVALVFAYELSIAIREIRR